MPNNTIPPKSVIVGMDFSKVWIDEELPTDELMEAFMAYANRNSPKHKPTPEPYLNHASARIIMQHNARCWLDKHTLHCISFRCPDETPAKYRFAVFRCKHCMCDVQFETNGNVPLGESTLSLEKELAYVERDGLKLK